MLAPDNRRLLREALRPAAGYELDGALATTYSLDLFTLLTIPLAFTAFDFEDEAGRPALAPLALLESLRRYAERMAVFCQAGRIAVPARRHLLYGMLEGSVVEVSASRPGGVFHPKVWILRYRGAGDIAFRLLCLSRNLTGDSSWDVMLALDGKLVDAGPDLASNVSLVEFVAALPGLADGPVSARVQTLTAELAQQLHRVRWELPEHVENIQFWPLGVVGWPAPFDGMAQRQLVISPFVTAGALRSLAGNRKGHVLVSRDEELDKLPAEALLGYAQVLTLSPQAETEVEDEGVAAFTGLHAKVYVLERGWDATIVLGSANATDAALHRNVEFLVSLAGKKAHLGIDRVLGTTDSGGLRQLLTTYERRTPPETNPLQVRLEEKCDAIRQALIERRLEGRVERLGETDDYSLEIQSRYPAADMAVKSQEVDIACWPINVSEESARPFEWLAGHARFPCMAFESLSGFVAFRVLAREEGQKVALRFVLAIPLQGLPEDRRQRILRAMLSTEAEVLQLLLLLLSDMDNLAAEAIDMLGADSGVNGNQGVLAAGTALCEPLLRALDRQPHRLDEVARLVQDLSSSPASRHLLPKEFELLWDPIWQVRQSLP